MCEVAQCEICVKIFFIFHYEKTTIMPRRLGGFLLIKVLCFVYVGAVVV